MRLCSFHRYLANVYSLAILFLELKLRWLVYPFWLRFAYTGHFQQQFQAQEMRKKYCVSFLNSLALSAHFNWKVMNVAAVFPFSNYFRCDYSNCFRNKWAKIPVIFKSKQNKIKRFFLNSGIDRHRLNEFNVRNLLLISIINLECILLLSRVIVITFNANCNGLQRKNYWLTL